MIENEIQAIIFGLASFMFVYLSMFFHEIGHYVMTRLFHFKSFIEWGFRRSYVHFEYPDTTSHSTFYIISLGGMLGVIAVLPFYLLTSDLAITLILTIYSICYPIIEVLLDYKTLNGVHKNEASIS